MDLPNTSPADWIDTETTSTQVAAIVRFLNSQQTFEFPSLSNGLFSAAAGIGSDFEATGYRNVWIRDNIQIAYAHLLIGQVEIALRSVEALASFLSKRITRFDDIIAGRVSASDPMSRPHVRFHGEDLTELPEKWAHAQNDALGYFLWLYGLLISRGHLAYDQVHWDLVASMICYFQAIQYWQDEDSGHWEESRKVSASSIGVVVAAMHVWQGILERNLNGLAVRLESSSRPVTLRQLSELRDVGAEMLFKILPSECNQADPTKHRRHDAALVFLCYPLAILPNKLASVVLEETCRELLGPHGIRRYTGDSYWCANYKDFLAADQRSVDFSDDLSQRDQLLQKGTEAQWCIFDPAISCAYGLRFAEVFHQDHRIDDSLWSQQVWHLQRSLSQLTKSSHSLGAFRCPESYFLHRGEWIPNDLTPLLWTQANLMQGLWWLESSLRIREQQSLSSMDRR